MKANGDFYGSVGGWSTIGLMLNFWSQCLHGVIKEVMGILLKSV